MKPQVDVLGLQEIGMTEKNQWLMADPGWGYYRPPALQQNPVIWDRSRLELVSGDGVLLSAAGLVEPLLGPADEPKSANWATVVRLRDLATGRLLSFVNVHLVAYAISAGRFIPERPRTARLYRQQLRTLVETVRQETLASDAVYVLGDFNAGYEEDLRTRRRALPIRQFATIGFRSMWEQSALRAARPGRPAPSRRSRGARAPCRNAPRRSPPRQHPRSGEAGRVPGRAGGPGVDWPRPTSPIRPFGSGPVRRSLA